MRFYGMPLPEVMKLTVKQLFYLGGRIRVLQAEEQLSLLAIVTNPHAKHPRDLVDGLQAVLAADALEVERGETDFDREGLARLRDTLKRKR